MSVNSIGLLFVVSPKEAKQLQTSTSAVFLRRSIPVALLPKLSPVTYFVKKGAKGKIIAKGTFSFAMCEDFSKMIRWEFTNILPLDSKLSAFNFTQYVSEKRLLKPLSSVPRGWAYVLV